MFFISSSGFSPPPRPEAVNTMDALDFSEEEIQEQLAILGYRNIPKHRLHEFKQGHTEASVLCSSLVTLNIHIISISRK